MVKDYMIVGIGYTAVALLFLFGTPFIIVTGIIKYINKIWR